MSIDVVAYGCDELFEVVEDAALELVLRQVAEEALDHVEPRGGGWREANMEALMLFQPALNPRMFVRGVVIADPIDFLFLRYRLIDHAQELQPFLMAVFLLAQAEDLAIGGVQGGEQGCGSVALVIVRHGRATALLHGQAGLGAIKCLYLSDSSRPPTAPAHARADLGRVQR